MDGSQTEGTSKSQDTSVSGSGKPRGHIGSHSVPGFRVIYKQPHFALLGKKSSLKPLYCIECTPKILIRVL